MAAAGNAAAATTTPARTPQISSEVAFMTMLWSRRRNQEDTGGTLPTLSVKSM
jgi:hypothetical protein